MKDHKNTILAVVLSALVLIAWQYFVGLPQMEKQKQIAQQQAQEHIQPKPGAQPAPQGQPQAQPQQPGAAPQAPGQQAAPGNAGIQLSREQALATSPRVPITTDVLKGSISLKGGRLDDLELVKYRETVDPNSPAIVLLAPSGSPQPFYSEFGWVGAPGATIKLPNADSVWQQEGSGSLGVNHPVTLTFDNGDGLTFRRTIAVDEKYLFTLKDEVRNNGSAPVSLFPYALISRHGTPHTLGYYILHEGLIGVLGEQGLQEITYKKIEEKKTIPFDATNAWLGITDKYWAAALLPDTDAHVRARFSSGAIGLLKTYQTDYLLDSQTIAPGATGTANARLFAGAKEVATVGLNFPLVDFGGYNKQLNLNKFDLLIDWGWFYFITKPLFWLIDILFHFFHNFGLAILTVTIIIKGIFFPLASKSYASMAKMKSIQPMMAELRERHGDDKIKQQQAMMELYKREKINPLAGCLPILLQVPVFFALYKVLFVTIEMRHAPFFGWIHDLAAPDPTNVFNLFGLIPVDPTQVPMVGHFLWLGAWPMIMGVTMFLQMKLNPAPPDPTQKMIFDWMPLIFTFMLASFPAGLVIYWAWNNTLSVAQQSIIMKKHGAKIELFDNVSALFARKKDAT